MQATLTDLLEAWEHNTRKIVSLLECSLYLRIQIQKAMPESEFSDDSLIDSLESLLYQLKAMREI